MPVLALPAFTDNYIWVVNQETNHSFFCVDPGDAGAVLDYARQNHLGLDAILITHHHADHAGGIPELLRAFPNAAVYGPLDPRIPGLTKVVRDEDIIHVGPCDFRILSIPGHTSSHIAYQEPSHQWVFCGDTLFSAGCGRVFEGTMTEMQQSLHKLRALPDATKVFCGHEYTRNNLRFATLVEPDNNQIKVYASHLDAHKGEISLPSTIGLEKQVNPFLRTDLGLMHEFAEENGIDCRDSLAVFTAIRQAKDAF